MNKNSTTWHCFIFVIGCAFVAALPGCGGTSQDDMRKYAIRRAPDPADEDEDKPKEDAKPAPNPTEQKKVDDKAVASNDNAPQPTSETTADAPQETAKPEQVSPASNSVASVDSPTSDKGSEASTKPLTPEDLKRQSAANLEKISKAWRDYIAAKRTFPRRTNNFSWRVSLLPYLGYESLYNKFELDESWDSSHNIELLSKIPAEFKVLGRSDSKTNILAIDGPQSLMEPTKPMTPAQVKDGASNTIAVVEVDDEFAVPWTKPSDHFFERFEPLKNLGQTHEDGFFVIWADGKIGWIDNVVDRTTLAKAYTTASQDGFKSETISYPPEGAWLTGADRPQLASTAAASNSAEAGGDDLASNDAMASSTVTAQPKSIQDIVAEYAARREQDLSGSRVPIPQGSELKQARDLIRELYGERYSDAKSHTDRVELAKEMLSDLSRVAGDLPGQYALLDVARQIATQAAEVRLALTATETFAARFEVDELDEILDTFEKLARVAKESNQLEELVDEAILVYDDYVYEQAYKEAARISRMALSAASKLNDRELVDDLSERRRWSEAATEAKKEAEDGFKTLESDPTDETANAAVGKFLCFFREDWVNGIPILANGNDRSLKRLASLEVSNPTDGTAQMELADHWWKESERSSNIHEELMQQRAAHWYQRALPELPAGLVRIRVERRLGEVEKQAG